MIASFGRLWLSPRQRAPETTQPAVSDRWFRFAIAVAAAIDNRYCGSWGAPGLADVPRNARSAIGDAVQHPRDEALLEHHVEHDDRQRHDHAGRGQRRVVGQVSALE